MSLTGRPIGEVNMKEFESITECHVKPGDLRKIYCTELKHDADQVCRVSYDFHLIHSLKFRMCETRNALLLDILKECTSLSTTSARHKQAMS